MKNLLLIIPNLNFGGAQRSFSKLSFELNKEYKVFIVQFNSERNAAYELGGPLLSLEVKGSTSVLGKFLNFIKRIIALRKIKKDKNIHITISFLEGSDYVSLLSFGTDIKILSIRGSKLNDTTITGAIGWIRKKILIPILYPRANKIVVVNEGIKKELADYYKISKEKIVTIPNYYDLDKLKNISKDLIPPFYEEITNRPFLVTFGRLAPEKGISPLLEIYSTIKTTHPEYRLIIIGDGPEYTSLEKKCLSLNLNYSKIGDPILKTTDVAFLGAQDNPLKFVSKADLYIMTSTSEGFPNALAESMICNVPVISTDCPWGPREILSPNTEVNANLKEVEFGKYGILMPKLNIDQESKSDYWASVISDLLNNKKLLNEYREKGAERMKDFSNEKMLKKWMDVIEPSKV